MNEGKRNLRGERNEVRADERQTDRQRKILRRETEDYSRKGPTNMYAKLAVETRGEITLQPRCTNQREWLAEI